MADVSENKPAEQVAEQQPQVASNGPETTAEKVVETPAEKPAETTTEKPTETPAEKSAEAAPAASTEEVVKDTESKPEENNERKRRGSFQRGGDNSTSACWRAWPKPMQISTKPAIATSA